MCVQQYRQSVGSFYSVHYMINVKLTKILSFCCACILHLYLYYNYYTRMLLLLGGDIETNPGPPTPKQTCPGKFAIIGSIHQGSPQFLITESGACHS